MYNLIRTLVFDEQVSLTVADTTQIVQTAIEKHTLSFSSARVLGKALSLMTFAASGLKSETGEISLAVQTDGNGGSIGVSGNRALYMRGYIANPQASGDEIATFGINGSVTVIRDDGYRRPFVGTCALPFGGGLDEAFETYYKESEQLPTRLKTLVKLDEKGECVFAGVVVLQPLPFADETVLERTENAPLEEILQELKEKGLEDTLNLYFEVDKSVWELRDAKYKCNCSREYLSRVLITLGEEELRKIIKEDGSVKIHCHYCNSDYEFTETDADELFIKS